MFAASIVCLCLMLGIVPLVEDRCIVQSREERAKSEQVDAAAAHVERLRTVVVIDDVIGDAVGMDLGDDDTEWGIAETAQDIDRVLITRGQNGNVFINVEFYTDLGSPRSNSFKDTYLYIEIDELGPGSYISPHPGDYDINTAENIRHPDSGVQSEIMFQSTFTMPVDFGRAWAYDTAEMLVPAITSHSAITVELPATLFSDAFAYAIVVVASDGIGESDAAFLPLGESFRLPRRTLQPSQAAGTHRPVKIK